MSKKKIAIYSVLFTIGLAITTYSFYKLDFKFQNIPAVAYGDAVEGTESFEAYEIKKIKGDFDTSLVTIKEHETEETKVVVNYEHYKNIKFEAKIKDEVLNIKVKQQFVWWNAFSFGTDTGYIEILIPKNIVFDYDIDVSAGKIEMFDINAKQLKVELSAGEVKINNSQIANAVIEVSAGDTHINNSVINHLTANVSAGGIMSTKLECNKIDFDVSAGAIKLEILGNKSDYNFDVSVSAGSSNVSDYYDSNNTKYIKGHVSAGEARFTFVER